MLCAVEMALEADVPTKTHVLNLLHRLLDAKPTGQPDQGNPRPPIASKRVHERGPRMGSSLVALKRASHMLQRLMAFTPLDTNTGECTSCQPPNGSLHLNTGQPQGGAGKRAEALVKRDVVVLDAWDICRAALQAMPCCSIFSPSAATTPGSGSPLTSALPHAQPRMAIPS